MSRPAISAAAFALTAGMPADARGLLHVDPEPCPRGRRLLVSVEPLEPSARGFELAAAALAGLRRSLADGGGLPPSLALSQAFATADADLLAENRPPDGSRPDRGVYVGATAAILTGHDLTIAQVPPTQALVAQDFRLYAFPDLASWRHDYVPAGDEPEPLPLGCGEGTRPVLYWTTVAPGDLILLCSSSLARRLGRDRDAIEALRRETETTPTGRVDGIEAALDRLGLLAAHHGLEDAHAAAIAVGRVPATFGGSHAFRQGWQRASEAWDRLGRRPSPLPAPGGATAVAASVVRGPAAPAGAAAVRRPPRRRWEGVGRPLERPAVGTARRLAAALRRSLGGPRRVGEPAPAMAADASWRAMRAAPGVGSIERFTEQTSAPADWRTNLPRGPEMHVPGRLLAVTAVAFLAFGGSGFALDRHLDRTAQAGESLAAVDAALGVLAASPPVPAASTAVAAADAALAAARRVGAPGSATGDRQRRLDAARDHAFGITRLARLTRLGTLPAEATRGGGRPSLVRSGDRVFLIDGALYEIDAAGGRLVRLLGPGDRVGGEAVGSLHVAAADASGVVVGDAAATFARDAGGSWVRRPLPPAEDGPWSATAAALFDGSLYTLAPTGELAKLPADAPSTSERWADAETVPDLPAARDLAIDGRVHLMLADGRIQTLFRGEVAGTVSPAVAPPITDAVALAGGDAGFYLLDSGAAIGTTAGRIVRFSPGGGGAARQLLAPADGDEAARNVLAAARDLVVDETAGAVYLVTDDALWRAELPTG